MLAGTKQDRHFYILIVPTMLVLVLMNIYPLLYSLYISLTNFTLTNPSKTALIGFRNYGHLFTDPFFFNALFKRTQSSSESQVATLSGLTASIVSPIPQHGVGEIAYVQGGTRYTAPARSESGAAITAGQTVCITRIVGSQFFVQPVD